jgi:hypothetical protein
MCISCNWRLSFFRSAVWIWTFWTRCSKSGNFAYALWEVLGSCATNRPCLNIAFRNNFGNQNNRTQKAVVEFIWIGGQFVGIPLDGSIDICNPQSADLSSCNLMWWGSNILWSLKKYENVEKSLVLWVVVAALQELKKTAPAFLETLVHSWASSLFADEPQCVSIAAQSSRSMHDMMPMSARGSCTYWT